MGHSYARNAIVFELNPSDGEEPPEARFKFLSFDAPANVFLSVDQINNLQTVVGYYQTTTSTPAIEGFAYFPFGQHFVTLVNPNTAPVGGTTYVYGENNLGTIVGQFLTAKKLLCRILPPEWEVHNLHRFRLYRHNSHGRERSRRLRWLPAKWG